MKKKKNANLNIKGVITPVGWNDAGKITRISIQTITEEEYVVELSMPGKELLSHINEKIKAHGLIRYRLDGKTAIRIKKYELIPDYKNSLQLAADKKAI